MSHEEMATFEYADACKQMLDGASARIEDTVKDLEAMRRNSSEAIDGALAGRISSLLESCREAEAAIKQRRSEIGSREYRAEIENTRSFLSSVNAIVLQASAISGAVRAAFEQKMSQQGAAHEGLDEYLSGIGDQELVSTIRILAMNREHDSLSLDELRELAESVLDPSKKVRRKLIGGTVSGIRERMRSEKVSDEVIEDVVGKEEQVSPLEMMDSATNEILDERLRRSAIQAIVKSISARGFIVNRRDIRHIREDDTVRIVARKPAGQTAEFSVDLRGKFVYHFRGYEGKACEKDISPMVDDLEKVYGIKMTDRKTIWENPDKHNKRFHQEMNVRRE